MLLPPLPGAGAVWQDPSKGGACAPESTCRPGGPLPPPRLAPLIEIGEERSCLQGARCSSIWLRAIASPKPPQRGLGDMHPFRGQVTLPCSACRLAPVLCRAVALPIRGQQHNPPGPFLPHLLGDCCGHRPWDRHKAKAAVRAGINPSCPASSIGPTPNPPVPPVLYSPVYLLSAWVRTHARSTLLPPEAPISHSGPLLHALTHPQTFNLVSNKISQPHYSSQAHHLHLNEWTINKVNSLRHRTACHPRSARVLSLFWVEPVPKSGFFLGEAGSAPPAACVPLGHPARSAWTGPAAPFSAVEGRLASPVCC